jgi:hypothetical protein
MYHYQKSILGHTLVEALTDLCVDDIISENDADSTLNYFSRVRMLCMYVLPLPTDLVGWLVLRALPIA